MKYENFPNDYIDKIKENPDCNYFTPVWDDVFQIVKPEVVVDIGCGNGVFSSYLVKKYNSMLVGVDGNEYALKKARDNGFKQTYLVNDFSNDKLPLETSQYEFVVCKDVLEHLLDPMHLLAEIHRILKADGNLVVHVPNHFYLFGRLKFLLTNDIDTSKYFPSSKSWNFPHVRFFTYKAFVEMLSVAGFKVIKNLNYHFPNIPLMARLPKIFRTRSINCLTKKYPSQFCEGFVVLAQKSE